MKRSSSVDSSSFQKVMKYGENQASPLQTTSFPGAGSSAQASFMSNVPPPPIPLNQNQMAAYYMANANAYYPTMVSPEMANGMYTRMTLSTWQMTQVAPPAVFDTSRPPPPPLPTTPAPENPPPPPPPQSIESLTSQPPPINYYKGRGGYGGHGGYIRRGHGKYRGGLNRGAIPPSSSSPPVASQPPPSGLLIKSPAVLNGQASNPTIENAKQHRFNAQASGKTEGDSQQKSYPILHNKKKRKPMSERLPTLEWKREDAQRVLELEKEYIAKRGEKSIIIRFPDPKLDYDIVKGFSSSIQTVHFQQPAAPRSCVVHLKKGEDVDKVIEELNKTPFGQGFLTAEVKREEKEDVELAVENIDPYTLYIGNIGSDVKLEEMKEMFSKAKKVDVGFAQKIRVTRYGFARYTNVDDAIEAYKANFNAFFKSRSLIVRFRRNNRSIGLDGDRKSRKKEIEKETETVQDKNTTEETAVENENSIYEPDSEDGEDEVEDSKTGVFDYANNIMENWLSDDLYESDYVEEEHLPNLTGMIKSEPEDLGQNDFLSAEDDDLDPTSKGRATTQEKSQENVNSTPANQLQMSKNPNKSSETTPNTLSKRSEDSNTRPNGVACRKVADWERIRQEELSEKEEKPDIQTLLPPLSPTPSSSAPITSYGLVPFIMPKEEEKDDEIVEEDSNKDSNKEKEIDPFESAFEQDEDNIDEAFESAWNELEVHD